MRIVTILNFALVCFVSLYGILNQGIYENKLNAISSSELLGEDVSNLMFGVMGLLIALFVGNSSKVVKLILLGLLAYFTYMYSYYCFSIISSIFFIAYISIFGVSFYLFIFHLIEMMRVDMTPTHKYPRKTLSYFFFFIVLIMTILEVPDVLKRTVFDRESITLFQQYYILDLAIVFPGIVIVAIMNFKQSRYSPILTGIALLKIMTIMPALLLNELFYWMKNREFLDSQFVLISSSIIVVSAFLFLRFKSGIDWDVGKSQEDINLKGSVV